MKKIMNKPESLVIEMCSGMVAAHPELELIPKYKVIKRRKMTDKVSLISGGGSGHEPAHAGFVGYGMLDAAVCGDVFASPSQIQVYQAIKACSNMNGVLLIIKNYSGDMMNFKNAAYLAGEDGIEVDYVKVNDDIAVNDSLYTVGRRGVAGTVLVHKVAGAAAEAGMPLAKVKSLAEKAIANVRSIGFALSSCTVPAKGSPTFDIGNGDMEYGVGIHGEPGIERVATANADEIANRMTNALLTELEAKQGDEVVLLVNGFGGTPLQELYLLNNAVMRELNSKKIVVYRTIVGNYMTALDMLGASLSIMKVDSELKQLIDARCDTPGLKIDGKVNINHYFDYSSIDKVDDSKVNYNATTSTNHAVIKHNFITYNNIVYILDKMAEIIINNEIPFCELDSHAGDGDFGMSIAKGFKRLKVEWIDILSSSDGDISKLLDSSSMVIMQHCGGASGPIWGSAFRAAAKAVVGKDRLTIADFADMMSAAAAGVQAVGARSFGRGAVVGDKTLIDALIPYADTLKLNKNASYKQAFAAACIAAVQGAKDTEKIVARMGRAGTVGERSLGYPDAGAYALGVIFTKLAESLKY